MTRARTLDRRFVTTVLVVVSVAAASIRAQYGIQRPGAEPAATMTPMIVKRQLRNGLRVWIAEQHELPVVQMSLLVRAGTDADPRGRYGVASLTSAILTEGAGSRTAVEIADALDALLANLSSSSAVDSTSLQLYVPVGRLAEALPLMADVAQRPTFPTQGLATLKRQRLDMLRNARDDPDAIAALAFARGSYGPSHRSSAGLIGTAESIQALTPEDLRAFHAAAYRPDNSTLILVGDVVPDQVLPLLDTHFGRWQPASVNRVAESAPAPRKVARQLMLIDMPGAPQSKILVGGVGGSNSYADFFPMQVLTTIVSDRLSSDRNPTAARLHDRRAIGLRYAQVGNTVRGRLRCAGGQDRRVCQGIARRVERNSKGHPERRARGREGRHRAPVSENVRTDGAHFESTAVVGIAPRLRPAGRLLRQLRDCDSGG